MNRKSDETTLQDLMSDLSNKGKHPSWVFSWVRGSNRIKNKKLREYPCQVCDYRVHVELAHIDAISSFPLETTLKAINKEENILVLCPNHHWEFDNGKLDKSLIRPRNELLPLPIKKREVVYTFSCVSCGEKMLRQSKTSLCKMCYVRYSDLGRGNEFSEWMDNETLAKLVWEKPTCEIAKELGISDSAIGKRCKRLGIPKPPRGYWEKRKHKK